MLANQVRVNNGRAVRPAVVQAAGGMVVCAAGLAQSCGIGDQRINHSRGDAPKKTRFTQAGDIHRAFHVRLSDYPNAVTTAHQLLSNQRRAGIGTINIGITADEDDVEVGPIQSLEFFRCGWDKHAVIITDICSAGPR